MKGKKNCAIAVTLVAAVAFVAVVAVIIATIAKPPPQKDEALASSSAPYSKPIFDIPEVEESIPPENTESSEIPTPLEIIIDEDENGEESIDRDAISLPKFEEPKDYGIGESD